MKFLLVAIVVLVVLFATGIVKVDFWVGSPPAGAAEETQSPTVRDVVALWNASTPDNDDLLARANNLLTRYDQTHDRDTRAAIEREWSTLGRRIDSGILVMYRQVVNIRPETSVGAKCRIATLRLLAKQRHVELLFTSRAARGHASPWAMVQLRRGLDRSYRWYLKSLDRCTAGASDEDQAVLASVWSGN